MWPFFAASKLVAFVSGVPLAAQPGQLAALITTAIVLYGSLGLFQNSTFQPVDEFRQIVLWSALSVILLAIVDASFAGLSLYEQWAFGLSILIMAAGWTQHPQRDSPGIKPISVVAAAAVDHWQRPVGRANSRDIDATALFGISRRRICGRSREGRFASVDLPRRKRINDRVGWGASTTWRGLPSSTGPAGR